MQANLLGRRSSVDGTCEFHELMSITTRWKFRLSVIHPEDAVFGVKKYEALLASSAVNIGLERRDVHPIKLCHCYSLGQPRLKRNYKV